MIMLPTAIGLCWCVFCVFSFSLTSSLTIIASISAYITYGALTVLSKSVNFNIGGFGMISCCTEASPWQFSCALNCIKLEKLLKHFSHFQYLHIRLSL